MNRPSISRWLALFGAALAMLSAGLALADPPARVARLGYMSGAISFSPAGDDAWYGAVLNRPLVTGDRLWVVPSARAELQIGNAAIRIGSATAINLLNLDDRVAQVEITQGVLNIHVRRHDVGQILEIDTPNLAFSLRRPGHYRIEVDPNDDVTTVIVREGQGDVYGDRAGYVVNRGEGYRYYGTGLRDFDRLRVTALDPFDRWASERERIYRASPSARYVSSDVIGYADLDGHGSWRNVPGYGNVWFPTRVAAGWAPYRDGHWSWIDPWGWTWIDDAPWGFAVSHYGRWTNVRGGWGWVPGPVRERAVYAPALVAFVGGGNFSVSLSGGGGGAIAWFPLGPREVYRPSYRVSREYFTRVNASNAVFTNVNITNYYNNTNVTNVTYVNQRVPGAVIAVPQQTFVQSQPVSRAVVRVDAQQVASQPVAPVLSIPPVQRSIVGAAPAGTRPPPAAIERTVVAKNQPPAPPPSFATRQQAMTAAPAQPLTTEEVEKLRPRPASPQQAQNQGPPPRVITAPPAQPTTPMATVQPAPPTERGQGRGRPGRDAPGSDAAKAPGSDAAKAPEPGKAPDAPKAPEAAADPRTPPGQRGRPEAPAPTPPAAQPAPPAAQPSPAPAPVPGARPPEDRSGPPGQRGRPEPQPQGPGASKGQPPQAQPVPAPAPQPPAARPPEERPGPPGQRGRSEQPAPPAPAAQPAPTPAPAVPAPPAARPPEDRSGPPGQRGRSEQPAPPAPAAQPAPTPAVPAPPAARPPEPPLPPAARPPEQQPGPPGQRGRGERPNPPAPAPAAQPAPAQPPVPAPAPPPQRQQPEPRATPQPPAAQPAPPPPQRQPEQRPPEQRAAPQPPAAQPPAAQPAPGGPPGAERRGQRPDNRKDDEEKRKEEEKRQDDERKGRGPK